MPTLTLTSRLDAVNTILSSSGEQPVSALNNSTADVANAEAILDELMREVQSEGWHFNAETDVPFTPDPTSKEITLPQNILSIDLPVSLYWNIDAVQRGLKLYDKKNHTYQFQQPLKAEVVYLLPFEELPETARRYIAVRAARTFHDRYVGSETQHRFTSDDELRALVNLNKDQSRSADVNLFRDNPGLRRRR